MGEGGEAEPAALVAAPLRMGPDVPDQVRGLVEGGRTHVTRVGPALSGQRVRRWSDYWSFYSWSVLNTKAD